ncbi:YhgE/Pip domain-containing protein [Bacillus massiliigorillae]|uniref:YhgE/Pip domain-containing protein n=1 Tax=Bacillus massiliigorillae TaxID=1243664 RepID=UPI0003AAF763|nr:ABC transporter permease [Bacillus massiliigorillae]
MKTFLKLLKNPGIIGGIVMAVFYQIIFITIFMYGYSAIPKNMDELKVAIVNDDANYGKEMAKQIKEQMPFQTSTPKSLENAKEKLENRDVHLIIHIPKDFSEKLTKQGEKVKLDYFINDSNPAMVSSTMKQVTSEISTTMNQQFATQTAQGIFTSMKMPEEQAKQLAAEIPTKLDANVVTTNKVPAGMHNQMAPFFITMVSFVGAMIFSMIVMGVVSAVKHAYGKWQTFWSVQAIIVLVSIIAPIIGIAIYYAMTDGLGGEIFVKMWLTHALEMFGAIEFMSIFSLLLGQKSIFVNLPFMLIQTISSGAVLTQGMMPGFFKFFSYISIMFYTVQVDLSVMFGGGKIAEHLIGLAITTAVCFLIVLVIYTLQPTKELSKSSINHAA